MLPLFPAKVDWTNVEHTCQMLSAEGVRTANLSGYRSRRGRRYPRPPTSASGGGRSALFSADCARYDYTISEHVGNQNKTSTDEDLLHARPGAESDNEVEAGIMESEHPSRSGCNEHSTCIAHNTMRGGGKMVEEKGVRCPGGTFGGVGGGTTKTQHSLGTGPQTGSSFMSWRVENDQETGQEGEMVKEKGVRCPGGPVRGVLGEELIKK